jgi:peptidoglycan/xylan/chitin deacetylase (PgdA/CDA1 family)
MTRKSPQIYVFLSHDVDWGKEGASRSHILAREDRFDEAILNDLDKKNPYQNVSEILEIEDNYSVRSTFFFRACNESLHPPPPYNLNDYKSDIRSMVSGGWDVGLHSDFLSHDNLERLEREKKWLEDVSKACILGNRTHYTIQEKQHGSLLRNLKELGFRYDTSVIFDRERLTRRDFGFYRYNGVNVFPITLMDALIFHKIENEVEVVKKVKHAVEMCEQLSSKRVITIIWHNCSLKMKFGRKYRDVLEYLVSRSNVLVKTGIELSGMIDGGEIQGF